MAANGDMFYRLLCQINYTWLVFILFEIDVWNGYIVILKSSHVRIFDADDCLVSNLPKNGKYSPKQGYVELINRELEQIWWWKVIWKLKCPLKTNFFVGFFFLEKL